MTVIRVLFIGLTAIWLSIDTGRSVAQRIFKIGVLITQVLIISYYQLELFSAVLLICTAILAVCKVTLLPTRFTFCQSNGYVYGALALVSVVLFGPLLWAGSESKPPLSVTLGVNHRAYSGEPINLSFPFQGGEFYIREGGSTRQANYHYWSSFFRDQGMHVAVRYAVDIYKVGTAGQDVNVAGSNQLKDYATYGEPLYSPCDGLVFYLDDGHPDMPIGQRDMVNTRGNHIVLVNGEIKIAMLHLMPGTIAVKVGEEVKEGQFLGLIGNSGATGMPHLHIHAARESTWFGEAVPMLFDGKFLIKGDRIKPD